MINSAFFFFFLIKPSTHYRDYKYYVSSIRILALRNRRFGNVLTETHSILFIIRCSMAGENIRLIWFFFFLLIERSCDTISPPIVISRNITHFNNGVSEALNYFRKTMANKQFSKKKKKMYNFVSRRDTKLKTVNGRLGLRCTF